MTLHNVYAKHQPIFEQRDLRGGDKGTNHSYIEVYEELFKDFREKPINFLEIGVQCGYSARMWEEYFPAATIHGIDIDPKCSNYGSSRIKVHILDATDPIKVSEALSGETFDVIIDDGSHLIQDQIDTYHLFFPKLRSGGIYIIEDVGDINQNFDILQSLHPSAQIMDRRFIKGRGDDVLVVIRP